MRTNILIVFALLVVATGCSKQPVSENKSEITAQYTEAKTEEIFQCPMHPHYTSTNGSGTCPICGMSLVAQDTPTSTESGGNEIFVSSAMIQTMGVRTAVAQIGDLGLTLRAFGTVETDERRESVIVSRLEGWIDRLQPRAEGDTVRPGALLYRVYSPNLISAQKDYVNSLSIGNEKRIASVRQRLISLGMQEAAIRRLDNSKEILERVPVYAEAGGIVAELDVNEGDYVKPGSPVMRLQSYTSVWIIARIPEQDLALVTTGLTAQLGFPSAPGVPVTGAVDYIYPTIDAKTRTGKVRIEVDNKQGFLRPGAYADIAFDLADEPRLSIPTEAVLRDSRGNHVILALGDGRFSSRPVKTGINTGGRTEVVEGLVSGDLVVASGQFMLDSEVNLSEGLAKFGKAEGADSDTTPDDPHVGHDH